MKIADYGKAITSYIESPTTAQVTNKIKVQPLDRTLLADGTEIIPQKKPKQLKDLFEKINRTVLAVRSNTISPELIVPNLEKETQEYIKDGVISELTLENLQSKEKILGQLDKRKPWWHCSCF